MLMIHHNITDSYHTQQNVCCLKTQCKASEISSNKLQSSNTKITIRPHRVLYKSLQSKATGTEKHTILIILCERENLKLHN